MLRTLFILAMIMTPAGVWADDAALLGPQTTTPATVGPASTNSGAALQPNGSTSASDLQSAGSGGANQAANAQTLQQAGNAEAIKLFVQGETESTADTAEESTPWWEYAWIAVVAVTAGGVAWWLSRRRKQRSTDKTPH